MLANAAFERSETVASPSHSRYSLYLVFGPSALNVGCYPRSLHIWFVGGQFSSLVTPSGSAFPRCPKPGGGSLSTLVVCFTTLLLVFAHPSLPRCPSGVMGVLHDPPSCSAHRRSALRCPSGVVGVFHDPPSCTVYCHALR